MTGWRITIDVGGGSRIYDEKLCDRDVVPGLPFLQAAVSHALREMSLSHAEPGEGEYQITATPVFP